MPAKRRASRAAPRAQMLREQRKPVPLQRLEPGVYACNGKHFSAWLGDQARSG